jgi:hypothetical protein
LHLYIGEDLYRENFAVALYKRGKKILLKVKNNLE